MARATKAVNAGGSRRYDNRQREARAQQTRGRVIDAARGLLVDRGYADTTIKAVAEVAGVSPETVYKHFGGKAGLVKAMWDATVTGDLDPVPIAARPDVLAIGAEPDPATKLRMYAALAAGVFGRLGPLMAAIRGATASDPELTDLAATLDHERLVGTGILAGHLADVDALRPDLDRDRARDLIWTYIAPELYLLLVHDRGWSPEEHEKWLADVLISSLLPQPAPSSRRR